MPVTLFTGLPGAGKTAQLVAEILRLREAEPGRPLFAMGINGLREDLAIPLTQEMLEKWWELPPGSIIALDECQEEHLMPKDRGNPAHWVQRITKVRHYGMDFLLTTQDPCNMSAYVRRLVDKHVHTIRKFGTQVIQRYTWGRCIDDPYSRREQKQATEDIATLPSKVFELYKSSQLHTMKRRIPRQLYLLGGAVVVAVVAGLFVPVLLHRFQKKNVEAISGGAALKPSTASRVASEDESLRHTDMPKWMRPRVPGVPWSAPMFDKLEVQAQPRLYCIESNDDGRCLCDTEQGTRYDVPLAQCHQIVQGGLYNPFLPPSAPQDVSSQGRSVADQPGRREAASPPAVQAEAAPVDAGVTSSQAWKTSPLSAAYVPPQLESRPAYTPTQLH